MRDSTDNNITNKQGQFMLNYIHIRIPTNPKTKIIYSHKMFFYHNPKTAFICAEWPWAQWPFFFFHKRHFDMAQQKKHMCKNNTMNYG